MTATLEELAASATDGFSLMRSDIGDHILETWWSDKYPKVTVFVQKDLDGTVTHIAIT